MASKAEVDSDEEELFWGPITVKELKASVRVAEQLTHRPAVRCGANKGPKEQNENPKAAIDLHQEEIESEARSAFSKDNRSSLHLNGIMKTTSAECARPLTYDKSLEVFGDSVIKTSAQNDALTANRTFEKTPDKGKSISFENSVTSLNSFTSSCTSLNSTFMVETESPIQETVSDSFESVDPKKYILKNEICNKFLSDTKSPTGTVSIMEISKFNSSFKENVNILNDENSLNESNKATNNKTLLTCVPKIDPTKQEDSPKNSPNKPKNEEIKANDSSSLNHATNKEEVKSASTFNSSSITREVRANEIKKIPFDAPDRINAPAGTESFETFPQNVMIPNEEKSIPSDHERSLQYVLTKASGALNELKTDLKNLTLKDPSPSTFNNSSFPANNINFSQLTEANLSCVSPPNLTIFDDTIASISQAYGSFSSGPDKREKIPGRKGSELLKVTSKLERKNKPTKYFSNLTTPKSSVKLPVVSANSGGLKNSVSSAILKGSKESENRNVLDFRKSNSNANATSLKMSVSTPNSKGVKEIENQNKVLDSGNNSKICSLLRSNTSLKTPRDGKTPSNRPAITSERKKKFFSTPPGAFKPASASKLKFTPANTFNSCSKSTEDRTRDGTGSAKNFPPSKISSSVESAKNKSSLRPVRFGIPQLNGKSGLPANSSTFKSNLPAPKVSSFSRSNSHSTLSNNLSSMKAVTTPAQNLTKGANGATQNKGSCSSSRYFTNPTFNYKGVTTPVPMSMNDSTSSVSSASFNSCSSADSSRSFLNTVPKNKSIPGAKNQTESRLPRFNGPSGIPRVNHCGSIYKSRAL